MKGTFFFISLGIYFGEYVYVASFLLKVVFFNIKIPMFLFERRHSFIKINIFTLLSNNRLFVTRLFYRNKDFFIQECQHGHK